MKMSTEEVPPGPRWALLLYKRLAPLDARLHVLSAQAPPLPDSHLIDALRTLGGGVELPQSEGRCCLREAVRAGLADAGSETGAELSLEQMGGLKLVDGLFHELEFNLQLHPAAYRALRPLQVVLARCLYEEPPALFDPGHPARGCLELLLRIARCYDDSAGQRGLGLVAEIARTSRSLAACELPTAETFQEAQAAFVAVLNAHQQSVVRLEQRLIEKERGESRLHDIRGFVRKTIDRAAAGKRIPDFVHQFLHEVWEKYLYIHFLRHGIEHPAWHQGVLDMQELIWSVTTRNGPKLLHRLPTDLADGLERIRQGAEAIHHQFAVGQFNEQLLAFHHRTIQGMKHPHALFAGAPPESDPAPQEEAVAGLPIHSAPPAVLLLRVGHWYRLSQRGRDIRAKLIERNLGYRYLLFVNLSGILLVRMDFDAFVQQLRIGYVEPLELDPTWERLLHLALNGVEQYADRIDGEIAGQEQEREAQQRQELRQRLEAEESRRAEALAEARRRAEEAARREREAAHTQAVAEVERLQPGGMVELAGEGGDTQVCALGLKLKSSRKLVFVDRNGRRVAELSVEQLADRLLDGAAAIIGYQGQDDRHLEALLWDLRNNAPPRTGNS